MIIKPATGARSNAPRVDLPCILRPAGVKIAQLSKIHSADGGRQYLFRVDGLGRVMRGTNDVLLRVDLPSQCLSVLNRQSTSSAAMNLFEVTALKERVQDGTLRMRVSDNEEFRILVSKDSAADRYFITATSYNGGRTHYGIKEFDGPSLMRLLTALPREHKIRSFDDLWYLDAFQRRQGLYDVELSRKTGIPVGRFEEYGIGEGYINPNQLLTGLKQHMPEELQLRPGDHRSLQNYFRAVLARSCELHLVSVGESKASQAGNLF